MSWKYWTRDDLGVETEHDWSNPDDPLPANTYVMKKAFLDQYVELCEDRSLLANGYFQDRFSDVQPIQVGDFVTQSGFNSGVNIFRLQFIFNSLFFYSHPDACCYVFIPSEDSGDVIGRSVSIYKTGSEVLVDCGLPEMRDLETSNELGFFTARRTQVHPNDPAFTGFEYGLMQAGDIVGAWLFEDMRRAGSRTGMILKIVDNGFLFFGQIFHDDSWSRSTFGAPWSSTSWYNGGGQQGASGSYVGNATDWSADCEVNSAGLVLAAFHPIDISGRTINWQLLCYPVDLGGTHQWTLGATYGVFNLVRSGSISDTLPIDYSFGASMNYESISPPFDSVAPSSASASFENRMAPEVFAIRTGSKPNPRGASILMSVSRS